jgi:hypothetical protein
MLAKLGSGATVAQLTLDQKVEGSNPSSPAKSLNSHPGYTRMIPTREVERLTKGS